MILFAEVSKFPSSLDLALETNFQNKFERLVYVEKYNLIYCIILDNSINFVIISVNFSGKTLIFFAFF